MNLPFVGIGGGFGLIGAFMLRGAYGQVQKTRAFLGIARRTPGRVVELAEGSGNKGPVYYPIIEFRVGVEAPRRFRSDVGSRPASHAVGDEVTVLWDPNDPESPQIQSFATVWGMAVLMGIMGAVFLIAGVLLLTLGLYQAG